MEQRPRIFLFLILVLLGAAVGVGLHLTVPQDQPTALRSHSGASITPITNLVDQQPLRTAQQLDKLATTREEARYSRDAVQVADNEVDLAFTSALRNARLHPPNDNPATKQLREHVRNLESQVASDQQDLSKLKSALVTAHGSAAEDLSDRQQLLSAELTLHQDELEDAKRDLMRAGGDDESRIQRLFAMHEASQHPQGAQPAPFQLREPFQLPGNTVAQLRLMWQLHQKRQSVIEARDLSQAAITDLNAKHDALEQSLHSTAAVAPQAGTNPTNPAKAAVLAAIQNQAENRKLLAEYDERVQDHQQLVQTYTDWSALLQNRMVACLHGVLLGVLWIIVILILVVLGDIGVDHLSHKLAGDRRRVETMKLLGHFVVQALGILCVVIVLLGPPNNLSTVIALTGAGLTVALKDFIVAFFGWFILMGKNGIRVGDWVEINGIGGEVVEIGLLRTVLLETGNWADSGHPTGRRVTFVNSFASEGHYFNFSTSGQWLWDTLEILVPTGSDPYSVTESVLQLVKKESEENAREAEKEWARAARDHGLRSFSAEPALSLRPDPMGTNIIVRYITRANERYARRTRLYEQIVNLRLGRSELSQRGKTTEAR